MALPRNLLKTANDVADAVRRSAAQSHRAPPKNDNWISAMMAWLSEPAHRITPPAGDGAARPIKVTEEVVVDAEVVEAHELPASQVTEEQASPEDAPPLPVPISSRELSVPAEDSAVKDLILRSPVPGAMPANLGLLRGEAVLPVSDRGLVVSAHPLNSPPASSRRPAAVLGGLAAVLAIVLVVVFITHNGGEGGDLTGQVAQHARLEQESPAHSVNTFQNPRDLSHPISLPANQVVLVSCRVYAASASSNAGDYWYRLLSGRWRGRFAPADTFLNGDPGAAYSQPNAPKVTHPHNYDTVVPVCSGGHAGGSVETPRAQRTPTFGDPARGTPPGPAITHGARVVVSCKLASDTPAAQPGGFVYRISSAPWNDHDYAPSRAFRNTVPANSTDLQLDDVNVPSCPR